MTLAVADLQRLSSLLDEALDLSAPERTRWLTALPAEAQPLAGTLRELLARHAEADPGDFASVPLHLLAEASDRGSEAAEGAQVGPYRLIRELGTGGMGAVWLAERSDGLLDRKVALKLPHAGWTRGLARARAGSRSVSHASARSCRRSSTRISRDCTTPAKTLSVGPTWHSNLSKARRSTPVAVRKCWT